MSDREGHSVLPPGDDDLSLPKATVAKMISGSSVGALKKTLPATSNTQRSLPPPVCSYSRRHAPFLFNARIPHPCTELLPSDVTCAKETRDLVIECCVGPFQPTLPRPTLGELTNQFHFIHLEFIHLISSEANEICEQDSKKTIAPEHIIGALKVGPLDLSPIEHNW